MDLTKIAHRIASKISHIAAYPEMEVANMETETTLKSYDVVIQSGKLQGRVRLNAESPEEAEEIVDREIEGMGWEDAGIVWDGYDPKIRGHVLDYEKRGLEKNFQTHGYETVSVTEAGPAANHS